MSSPPAVWALESMSSSKDELRVVLREELASALSVVKSDVQKLQVDLAEAMSRINSLERSTSSWPSPRSALRSPSSAEPPRKSSRSSVGFSPRAQSEDAPISNDTLILNSFPAKTSRDEVKAWLDPMVQRMVGNVEYTLSSRTKYSSRIFLRFESAMRAKAFSVEWRKEARHFEVDGTAPVRIYINWKLSPSRAREEFLQRQFYIYARDVFQLQPPKLEKERSTRTIYFDKVLIAKVEQRRCSSPLMAKALQTSRSSMHGWRRRSNIGSLFSTWSPSEVIALKLALLDELGPFCSWNARGLFSVLPSLRRSKIAVASQLGKLGKLVFFQETHGEHADWTRGLLPTYHKFISPYPDVKGKGGVIIAVEKQYLGDRLYDWDHIHRGRIARLRLPSLATDDAITSLCVIHLEGANNSHHKQLSLIAELKRVLWDDESDLKVLVGDFNFAVCPVESEELLGLSRSAMHSRLANAFSEALPEFTAINPMGSTQLIHGAGLDRCCINAPLEALEMRGVECVSLPYPSFFAKGRPSDHLPVVVCVHRRPRPHVPPLPHAHALATSWKEFALAELKEAKFDELPCLQKVSLLPL